MGRQRERKGQAGMWLALTRTSKPKSCKFTRVSRSVLGRRRLETRYIFMEVRLSRRMRGRKNEPEIRTLA